MTRELSLACEHGSHQICHGCTTCPCHHQPPPPNFRDLVAAAREQNEESVVVAAATWEILAGRDQS